jgi:biotin transport system substrate-specific component
VPFTLPYQENGENIMSETQTKKRNKLLDIVYIGVASALIAVCSWITIPLPTVPITLQTLGVCVVAGLLGFKRGTLATAIYIILGAIGVPVFANFSGGFAVILGQTGGYIIGFIFTAMIVGFVSDKFNGKLLPLIIAMVVGILVCYAFGTAWFAVVYAKSNDPATLLTILGWCVFPFLLPDAVKIAIAGIVANRVRKLIK